jgi:hypothetical protein
MKLKKVTFQDIIDAYTGDPAEVGKKSRRTQQESAFARTNP